MLLKNWVSRCSLIAVALILLPAVAGATTYNFTAGTVEIRATLEGTTTSVLEGPVPFTIPLGGTFIEVDFGASTYGTVTGLELIPVSDFMLDLDQAATGGVLDLIEVRGAELNEELGGATADLDASGNFFLDTRMKAWVEGINPPFPTTFVTEVTGATSGNIQFSGDQIQLGMVGVNLARFEQLGNPDPNAPKIVVKADFTFLGGAVIPEPGTALLLGLGLAGLASVRRGSQDGSWRGI